MSQYEYHINGLPETTNSARGKFKSWANRHKHDKQWKLEVWVAVNESNVNKPARPLKRAEITLVRCSSIRPDYEGLVSTFKPILDGLIESGVIENDNHKVIGVPSYQWEYTPKLKGSIKIFVRSVEECQ